jgi:hypothetical protein
MKTPKKIQFFLPIVIMSMAAAHALGAGTEIKSMNAVPNGGTVYIDIELTSPVKPVVRTVGEPSRLIIDFPNVSLNGPPREIVVNQAGVKEVSVAISHGTPLNSRIIIGIDAPRPFGIRNSGNKFVLSILPHPAAAASNVTKPAAPESNNDQGKAANEVAGRMLLAFSKARAPEVEHVPVSAVIDEPWVECPVTSRQQFKVKFIAGNTVYIDGGSNSGLRVGMNFDIRDSRVQAPKSNVIEDDNTPVAAARIVGVAKTSAILEVGASTGELRVGDQADLIAQDAAAARQNVLTGPENTLDAGSKPVADDPDSSSGLARNTFRSAQRPVEDTGTRTVGRIGFDTSGISSTGSTPGTSLQLGMSFQSSITHILGSHWNLEGYWRGRFNRHSQFQEATIEDSLNKTYTMQLYYDNPNSKWVGGVGRLYLPWAVSLDTVDGGYFGRKLFSGNASGIFAGSTPDLNSWHYRPNQRVAGLFTNFEGGDYDGFRYSSTTGVAVNSIKWKLDRPFAFFENELSYKGKVSAYHSLIVDSPQGVSTNGLRPGVNVSHSYFTLHYQPKSVVSLDLYHNFFRDVPTAATTIVATGVVDKLLFQGISAGTHIKPNRYFTFYTTIGTSNKTGDAHHSLNQMFGATWNEVSHTGIRADYHYSKFDSNFGTGSYAVLSLSRQLTNRMFWNVQFGNQNLVSQHTVDSFSKFVDDSVDVNLGRHSYLQSGYTYVKGDTLNYRQWYLSWGFRLDRGKSIPQYVQTQGSH